MAKKMKARPKPRFTRPTPKRSWRDIYEEPDYKGPGRRVGPKANPKITASSIRGWVRAKAVKIVRDSKGRAVKALIRT